MQPKKRTERKKQKILFIYNVNEGFVFPEDELDKVMDDWEDKKFFFLKHTIQRQKKIRRWL